MRRLLLSTFCVIALLTKTDPQSAHEYSRLGTVESIVHRGTYQLDGSTFIDTVDKIYRNGHYYSHQPPLLPTMEAPIYWVLQVPGTRFNNRGRAIMTYAFTLLTNGVALALTVVVFAQCLALAGVAPPLRDWLAVLLPFATWLLPYGLVSTNHGISGLLVACLSYLLLAVEWRGMTDRRALLIGISLGLMTAFEIMPIVSFVPLTIVFLAVRRDLTRRGMLLCAAGVIAPLIAHALINVRITGDVIPAGFHHELFMYPGSVFTEESLAGNLKYASWSDALHYAWTALFAGRGFFTFAPVALLGIAVGMLSWRWWARARGTQLVLLGSIALSLGAALMTSTAYGGEAVGFRHGVYLMPACLVLLLPWIAPGEGQRRFTPVVVTIAAISAAMMLVFAVRNPWSELTITNAPVGTWRDYVPIVYKVASGTLFKP